MARYKFYIVLYCIVDSWTVIGYEKMHRNVFICWTEVDIWNTVTVLLFDFDISTTTPV